MAQFDVHVRRGRGRRYALDIQTDFLSKLDSRLVVPLTPAAGPDAATRLNPRFMIGDEPHVMLTQTAGAVPVRDLGERIASLAEHRDEIIAAVDFLITGV